MFIRYLDNYFVCLNIYLDLYKKHQWINNQYLLKGTKRIENNRERRKLRKWLIRPSKKCYPQSLNKWNNHLMFQNNRMNY